MPVLTAISSFFSTNTDDLVVLMLLYAQAKGPRDWRGSRPSPKKIDQWKRILVPVVLIGIGLLILLGIA